MNTPFVLTSLFLMAGILVGSFFPWNIPFLFLLGTLFSVLACLLLRKSLWLTALIGIAFFCLGGFLAQKTLYSFPKDHLSSYSLELPQQVPLRAIISDEPIQKRFKSRAGRKVFKVQVPFSLSEIKIENQWQPASGKLVCDLFFYSQAAHWKIGEKIECLARLEPLPQGGYGNYLKRRRIAAIGKIGSTQQIKNLGQSHQYWVKRKLQVLRQILERKLVYGLDETQDRQILMGLVFGTRTQFSPQLKKLLLETNTYHIMAISGFNMALVILILTSLLSALGLPYRLVALIMGGVILVYMALVGWPASATRAGVMSLIFLLGWALNREVFTLNQVALSAFIILIFSPMQLFMPGFQLSYMVVLGLIFWTEPLLKRLKKWFFLDRLPEQSRVKQLLHSLLMGLSVSFIAWLSVLPIILCLFGSFSLYSVLTNLVIAGTVSIVTGLGLTALLVNLIETNVGLYFNEVNALIIDLLIGVLRFFHQLPGSFWQFPKQSQWWLVLYYFIMFYFVYRKSTRENESIS